MNLGENIYRFRTERNMSQGALAEALDVSRQSVSKWENNYATPEVDKLLKMSELFGVTLDQLVGKEAFFAPGLEPVATEIPVRQTMPSRQISGIILLCFGFLTFLVLSILGGLASGLILSAPLFILAAICLICKTRVILKCCWALLIMICEYISFATGTSRRTLFVYLASDLSIFLDYPYVVYTIISLVINVLLIVLVIWTVRSCNKKYAPMTARGKYCLLAGWGIFLLCLIPMPRFDYDYDLIRLLSLVQNMKDWIQVGLFTVLLTYTLRLLPKRKETR